MWVEVNSYNYGATVINTDNICRFEPYENLLNKAPYEDMTMIYLSDKNTVLADMPYEEFRFKLYEVSHGDIYNFREQL